MITAIHSASSMDESQPKTLKKHGRPSLRDLAEKAKSPEELQAILDRWREPSESPAKHDRPKFIASTLAEVASVFGVSEATVRQWRLETPPMPGHETWYSIPECVQWRIARVTLADLAAAKKQQDYDAGAIKLERERIELAREKGEIVDRTDVDLWASVALTEMRESIMRLPEVLAAASPPDLKSFVREETERHCRDTLVATQRRLEAAEIGKVQVNE